MINDILTVQDAVLITLEEYPDTADNDNRLIQKVLEMLGHKCYIPYDAPAVESITRARRLIQAKGLYHGRETIRQMRLEEEENMRQWTARGCQP